MSNNLSRKAEVYAELRKLFPQLPDGDLVKSLTIHLGDPRTLPTITVEQYAAGNPAAVEVKYFSVCDEGDAALAGFVERLPAVLEARNERLKEEIAAAIKSGQPPLGSPEWRRKFKDEIKDEIRNEMNRGQFGLK